MNHRGLVGVAAVLLVAAAAAGATIFSFMQADRVADESREAVAKLEHEIAEQEQRFGELQPVGGVTYYLAGSGVGTTDTSIVLTSFKTPVSSYPLGMSDFGDIGYLTLEPGNSARQEFVSFSGVTQNGDGSATLTGVTRGLSPVAPYTASTTVRRAHPGGSQAALSNPPAFYNQFAIKDNDETITGQWTFDEFPVTPDNSAASETVAGVAELATGAEAAASTASGGVGRLVLPTTISTSTRNSLTAANVVPVTDGSGYINDDFLAYAAPVGTISAYASTSVPTGWLFMDGSCVSRATYADLFTLLGTYYDVGCTGSQFGLPNASGRSLVMASTTQTATSTTNGTASNRTLLGYKGGETMHTQTENELAQHDHADGLTTANVDVGAGAEFDWTDTATAGNSVPFNVLDPYIVFNFIIKY